MKQKKLLFGFSSLLVASLVICGQAQAQLYINGATFFIQPGATVTVQGNVTSNTDIQGTGLVVLNGSINQTVDMGGAAIPKLQINNAANATLLSNLTVSDSLLFTSGKITLGTNNLTLTSTAGTAGAGGTSFIETNSTGQAIKDVAANVTSYQVPVGTGASFRPAFITTSGSYAGGANVGIRTAAASDPNNPPMISDHLTTYWPVTQTGITGTLNVAGQYINATDVSGTQANLKGYFFNGTDWSSATGTSNTVSSQVAANVTTPSGEVTGLDGFILLKTKVFLQGAGFNTTTLLMSDALRAANLIPLSDPYRTNTYAGARFTVTSDNIAETTTTTVLGVQPNTDNNIVDWIFLELRDNTAAPGHHILQTRSALLEKNGTIVDVDGVSPVTFNNVAAGSYSIAIKHRNHLGICVNPANNTKALSETKSTATVLDFTTASSSNLFGTAGTNYYNTGTVNLLYAGNANFNTTTRYTGPSNDKDYMLSAVLGGISTTTVNGYNQGDINMNGSVKFAGPSNDKDFLLSTILAGNGQATKTESLP